MARFSLALVMAAFFSISNLHAGSVTRVLGRLAALAEQKIRDLHESAKNGTLFEKGEKKTPPPSFQNLPSISTPSKSASEQIACAKSFAEIKRQIELRNKIDKEKSLRDNSKIQNLETGPSNRQKIELE